MTEQSFTAEQLEQAARAILIDHKYSISDIKDQYKQQIYEALIKLSPAFALSYIPESENKQEHKYIYTPDKRFL